jgi:flagellar biogenesis protein FliO
MHNHIGALLLIIWVVGVVFWILNQFHQSNLRRDYPGQIK